MRKLVFLFVLFATFGVVARAADVTFKASAPEAVVMGETFRLSYTVNAEGRDIRVPEIPDFEVLIGPSTSTNMSTQIINGKMTTETSLTFTYILQPKKEGTFNIAPATIKVKGANYTSNALVIKVLPPDKAEEATKGGSTGTGISKDDAFLTIDVSKRNVYEQEGILVTFKLYVRKDIGGIDQPKFPEFTGFLAQEVELPQNKQLVMENYKGKNYGTAIIKQTVLYPQRSGKITIPSGKLDIVLRVPGTHTPQRTVGRMFHCRSTSGHNGKIQGSHRTRITEESYPNPGRGNSNQRGNHNPAASRLGRKTGRTLWSARLPNLHP